MPTPLHPDLRRDRPEVFISYASKDRALAVILQGRLVAAGFSVWFDQAGRNPGYDWHKEIEGGCEAACIILPLLTRIGRSPTGRGPYASHAVIPMLGGKGGGRDADAPVPVEPVALDQLTAGQVAWQTTVRRPQCQDETSGRHDTEA